jgi:hypothetical protein
MIDKDKWESLTDNLKSYVNTQIELLKLQLTEKVSAAGSTIFSSVLLVLTAISCIFFLSCWAALYLSARIGDTYSGFAIVGGFYLLVSLILVMSRKQLLVTPIRNQLIKVLFKKED